MLQRRVIAAPAAVSLIAQAGRLLQYHILWLASAYFRVYPRL
jgi:hypothetical protein